MIYRSGSLVVGKSKPSSRSEAVISVNSSDWVFTQATALTSVVVGDDGYSIDPSCNHLVNNNGDAWSNRVIKDYYKTFIGSHNYVDHVQVPSESKGLLVDCVLREVDVGGGKHVYYVDTLILTSKRDKKWSGMVKSGKVRYLSMGCISSSLVCSVCGYVSYDDYDRCDHMVRSVGMFYMDGSGVKRKVACLVNDDSGYGGDGFMNFVELSYLSVAPAFHGAIQGHVIETPAKGVEVSFNVPRKVLRRSAFQTWRSDISGVPYHSDILKDEDLKLSDYKV